MWRILIFLAAASALALGAVWLADRPGEVTIVWGGLTIETTVAVAAIGVGVLVVLGMMLWSVVRFLLGLPTAFSFASAARRRSRGIEAVSRGMIAVGAGDPAAARRYASDASKLIPGEPLTLLLNAQAAQLSGDKPAAEAAFKAMLDEPETRVLGLRGLFVEARRRGDEKAARAFADEAVRLVPSLAWANDALLEFHTQAGEWSEARTAVERRTALRLTDRTEAKRHRAVLLAAEALSCEESDPARALSLALEAVKLAPGLVPAAAMAGRMLAARGDLRKAARTLEAAWREQPHPDLARVYVRMRQGDSAGDRLQKAKALMRLRPTDPESAFAVAQAAIEARDFAQARSALQPLVAATPTVKTCLLMAAIEDGEFGSSGRGREWLQRSTRALPDHAWVADGVVSQRWLPVSPVSGRLDAFVWTAPPPAIGGPVLNDEPALVELLPASAAVEPPTAVQPAVAPPAPGPVDVAEPVASPAIPAPASSPEAGAASAAANASPGSGASAPAPADRAEAEAPSQPAAPAWYERKPIIPPPARMSRDAPKAAADDAIVAEAGASDTPATATANSQIPDQAAGASGGAGASGEPGPTDPTRAAAELPPMRLPDDPGPDDRGTDAASAARKRGLLRLFG